MARSLAQLFYAMGGSVSPGKSNDELVDHLIDAEFIRTNNIIRVFRAVDRGNYYHPDHKVNAYKDVAWKMGNLHLSAPCVYSVVMEALKLKPGLSFLNLGSGSGYLSTMVGLVLGQFGTNHGIEFHEDIVEYAYERLEEFLKTSEVIDEFDFCEPVFSCGNCLTLDSNVQRYDRVYCGAACPEEYESYVKNLIKVNGILIMPLNDRLLKITRVNENTWTTAKVLSVSFAQLIPPPATKRGTEVVHTKLSDITPPNLQQICRFKIRSMLRKNVDIENPDLKLKRIKNESRPRRQVRRIVIPFFDESDLSNSQSDSDFDYDSDSPEYTISSRLSSRVSVFLEDFLRRHAELQILRRMEAELSSGSDNEVPHVSNNNATQESNQPSQSNSNLSARSQSDSNPSARSSPMSFLRIHSLNYSDSSDESDSSMNKAPSQSTRSKKKLLSQKRKLRSTSSPSKTNTEQGPSTSSSASSEPRRKQLKRTSATRVIWENVERDKKSYKKKEAKAKEESPEPGYTHFLLQKIGALPLPRYLLQYLNYRRENL